MPLFSAPKHKVERVSKSPDNAWDRVAEYIERGYRLISVDEDYYYLELASASFRYEPMQDVITK